MSKTVLYASDLDRTLIYSQAFIDMHPVDDKLILVDESKMNSYMSERVADEFKNVLSNDNIKFVPVTTRSTTEYNRIKFPFETPEIAVVASGGVILNNGVRDKAYQDYIDDIAFMTLGKKDFTSEFEQIVTEINNLEEVEYSSKVVDNTFVFSKTTDLRKTRESFKALSKKHPTFRFMLDKHKIYAIPSHITKKLAVDYLKGRFDAEVTVASGDSAFDIPLLQAGNVKIVPSHTYLSTDEISQTFGEGGVTIVEGDVLSPLNTFKIIKKYL